MLTCMFIIVHPSSRITPKLTERCWVRLSSRAANETRNDCTNDDTNGGILFTILDAALAEDLNAQNLEINLYLREVTVCFIRVTYFCLALLSHKNQSD
jgi:hypothetical protein